MVPARKSKRLKKVLIIKLGYSETLDREMGLSTSLGDVLRTTFLLHYFKNHEVSWLVDKKAAPLLAGNRYIKEIFFYNQKSTGALSRQKFDTVINFEKTPPICDFADSLNAGRQFGFSCRKNSKEGRYSGKLYQISFDVAKRRKNDRCWQEILVESIGKKWNGEPYILGYRPSSPLKHDIGFNWTTSKRWRNKNWPKPYWHNLEDRLKNRYSISWQRGFNDLNKYIEWINSCKLIITGDSLGLHVSLALGKKVIALFGPTSPVEIYPYGCGRFISPECPYKCTPCCLPECDKNRPCIEYIFPETVEKVVVDEFKRNKSSRKI